MSGDLQDCLMITGGAGFIGQNLVHRLANTMPNRRLLVVDKLTYAANPASLSPLIEQKRVIFERADICDLDAMSRIFKVYNVADVAHLAAESHVDRSIEGPDAFFETNIYGTYTLLKAARAQWAGGSRHRFLHVSTDEVFGDLSEDDPAFHEETPYKPSSPYSASKAASDHLASAFCRTYGLPVLITNCSNNYGPYQHPEKLIPLIIINALRGKALPVYGDGKNIRDWLFVEDHAAALEAVLLHGRIGETYCVGGGTERRNIEVVHSICDTIDAAFAADPALAGHWPHCPSANGASCRDLISFVRDRPGHDQRYAINGKKLETELGYVPAETFESGIHRTVYWYLNNRDWWQAALAGDNAEWFNRHYSAERHGVCVL